MGLQPRRINGMLKRELGSAGIRYKAVENTICTVDEERELRKVPSERLAARVGVLPYYHTKVTGLVEDTPTAVSIPLKMHIGAPAADVEVVFVDRFNGSLVICGDVASVEAALKDVLHVLHEVLGFALATEITRT